ncbi:MAG: ATP-binding cassette domain-containing protein [Oscillospiraceae bacterium]|nr:ATP-binding cassette domain-containing protein [Oscillospiraceae bacterium]
MIEMKHLSKTFGDGNSQVAALRDVNIAVEKGEIFGIIGLSGAGKSTLVRCINLLERPDEGEVLFHGKNLMAMSEKELRAQRKKITMIFQHFNLLDQRTSLENVCFPLELVGTPKKEAKKRAMELLETVGLPDKANAYPVQLSGGQKQRIAIARALATNPEVLLCDEATSALDPKTTRETLRLLQDINKNLGVTVIIITHDMKVIEEICGRVAILNHGVVAEIGKVEDVFSMPKTEAGRRLVYPDGLPAELLPKTKVIRVAFNGGTAYQPLIASLAIDCGVKVNILGADTRNIDGKAFGTMLLGLPEDETEAANALAYITSQKDITVEEVPNYHA